MESKFLKYFKGKTNKLGKNAFNDILETNCNPISKQNNYKENLYEENNQSIDYRQLIENEKLNKNNFALNNAQNYILKNLDAVPNFKIKKHKQNNYNFYSPNFKKDNQKIFNNLFIDSNIKNKKVNSVQKSYKITNKSNNIKNYSNLYFKSKDFKTNKNSRDYKTLPKINKSKKHLNNLDIDSLLNNNNSKYNKNKNQFKLKNGLYNNIDKEMNNIQSNIKVLNEKYKFYKERINFNKN